MPIKPKDEKCIPPLKPEEEKCCFPFASEDENNSLPLDSEEEDEDKELYVRLTKGNGTNCPKDQFGSEKMNINKARQEGIKMGN